MKKFIILFSAGLVFFLVVNFISDFCRSDGADEPGWTYRYGFPFLYETGPDYQDRFFSAPALAADIGIALVFSSLFAGFTSSRRRHIG